MCKFFSAISNGKGKVLFFKVEEIAKIMAEGNKEGYDWNSHTSCAHFNNIKGKEEDKWNKWEYNPDKKELKIDGDFNTKDDSKEVKKQIKAYLKNKDIPFLRNLYNRNSGNYNPGDCNPGNRNSGNYNPGDCNSGDCNSGNCNSGNYNPGNCNSGDYNPGDCNSGNYNSGDYNSGYCNSDSPKVRMFNKKTNLTFTDPIDFPNYFWFNLTKFVDVKKMTAKEKKQYPHYNVTTGFLRTYDYKEAWKNSFKRATKKDVEKTLKLPNFSFKVFEEISGITKKDFEKKLRRKLKVGGEC